MNLKSLKVDLVLPIANAYLGKFGEYTPYDDGTPKISASMGHLHLSYTVHGTQAHLNIWDHSTNKKVFFVTLNPFKIMRCDSGSWFDVFLKGVLATPYGTAEHLAATFGTTGKDPC